jgi:hypothetical protein
MPHKKIAGVRDMGSYIDFIEALRADRQLSREFKKMVKDNSSEELNLWFETKGYDVGIEACAIIILNNKPNFYVMEEAIPYLFLTH